MRAARPIIVAAAALVLLWDFASWTVGLAVFEKIAWSVVLFGLSYGLFAWIAKYVRLWVVLVISILIILIIRITLAL
jgi:hypothetical protein